MNVLIQNPYMKAGGAENRIRLLIESLVNMPDITVHFMFTGEKTAHNIQAKEKFHLWQIRKENVLGATKNIIRDYDIDIVQLHNNQLIGTKGIEYAQSIGLPTVWVMHDFWTLCYNRFMTKPFEATTSEICHKINKEKCIDCVGYFNWYYTKKQREIVNNCDIGIVPSPRIKKIFENNNFLLGKLKIIEPWIDLDTFHPTGEPRDSWKVFFAGNYIPHKGVRVLLRSWIIVQKILPMAKLFIQGDYRMQAETVQIIKNLKLRNIIMLNHMPKEQLRSHYNTSSITVFPSIWEETFGQIWAESLACGTPVIASKTGGIADLMKEGGVFFEPRNHVELAENIIDLLLTPSKRQELALKGYDYVRERFNKDRAGVEFTNLYHRLEAKI